MINLKDTPALTGEIQMGRVFDPVLIKKTITNPSVYPHVSDDMSPAPEDFSPVIDDGIFYVTATRDGEYKGLFMLHPINGVTLEVHTCLLPSARGAAYVYAKRLLSWVWENTAAMRVVTQVPANNRLARKLALAAGMTEYGLNPQSFMKDGMLYDIHLLGISREDLCQ